MKKTITFVKTFFSRFNLIANLTAKNLALHQQLIVLNRSIKRPQIKTKDRLFWIIVPSANTHLIILSTWNGCEGHDCIVTINGKRQLDFIDISTGVC